MFHFYMKQPVKVASYHLAPRKGKLMNPSSLLFLGADRRKSTTLIDAGAENV